MKTTEKQLKCFKGW